MNPLQPSIVRPFALGATPMVLWVAYNLLTDLYASPVEPNLDDTSWDLRVKALQRYSPIRIVGWVMVFGLFNTLLFRFNSYLINL